MYSYEETVCLEVERKLGSRFEVEFCIQPCFMMDKDEENERENLGGDCDVSNCIGIAWARWAEAGIPES